MLSSDWVSDSFITMPTYRLRRRRRRRGHPDLVEESESDEIETPITSAEDVSSESDGEQDGDDWNTRFHNIHIRESPVFWETLKIQFMICLFLVIVAEYFSFVNGKIWPYPAFRLLKLILYMLFKRLVSLLFSGYIPLFNLFNELRTSTFSFT